MIVPLNKTIELLEGQEQRIISAKDEPVEQQRFIENRAKGILITDSYNNPFFPIRPKPIIDTNKFDLPEVFRRYRELYAQTMGLFLPFHYCIEIIDNRYYVFNTRPNTLKFPMTTKELLEKEKSRDFLDNETINKIKNLPYDIENYVVICIIGSSELDVYPIKFYETLGKICCLPLLLTYRIKGDLYNSVFDINMGRKFKLINISKFVRK